MKRKKTGDVKWEYKEKYIFIEKIKWSDLKFLTVIIIKPKKNY